jgi:hypothetical protein
LIFAIVVVSLSSPNNLRKALLSDKLLKAQLNSIYIIATSSDGTNKKRSLE